MGWGGCENGRRLEIFIIIIIKVGVSVYKRAKTYGWRKCVREGQCYNPIEGWSN